MSLGKTFICNVAHLSQVTVILLPSTVTVLYKYLPFRMSAEDLETQPPRKKTYFQLIDSIQNGMLRGRSLPTLLDVPLRLDADAVCVPDSDADSTNCKDGEKPLVKVVME